MTKEELKQKAKVFRWEVDNWCFRQEEKLKWLWQNHKQEILVLTPVLIGTTEKVIRGVRRDKNLKEERYLKENYVYDRSRGCYIELRRKLTNRELLELDRRYRNGESLIEVLSSMRVVKR